MKKLWIGLSLLLVVFLTGGGFFFLSRQKNSFQISHPKRGPVEEAIYGLGQVRSSRVIENKVGVITAIRRLFVREGQKVKKGTLLIDYAEGGNFSAPFDGTVTALPYHENETVFPQTTILRLEDLTTRYIEVALEQQGALRVKPGQGARLSFESLRGSLFRGKVDSVYPSNGQFLVRIEVDNLPPEILPGMTADVSVEVGRKEDSLLVPVAALMNGKVTIQRNGKTSKVALKIGSSDGQWAEVLEGDLQVTDDVILPNK